MGAGVTGLTLAFEASTRGWNVKVYDRLSSSLEQSPSHLERQIIRPHYTDHIGLGCRIGAAKQAWQRLFSELGQDYFSPVGVIAVSQFEGDWADRSQAMLQENHLPFRRVGAEQLSRMMPGLRLENARFGILADQGGVIAGRALHKALLAYLVEAGVEFCWGKGVDFVDRERAEISCGKDQDQADWVIVTADHARLMPERFGTARRFVSMIADLRPPPEFAAFWRYAPAWVDLGESGHLWGIPRGAGGSIRIGSGANTSETQISARQQLKALLAKYRSSLFDYGAYDVVAHRQIVYHGVPSGEMRLIRDEQTLGLLADNGHGFKFAALNAEAVMDGIESGAITFAARQVAGAT